MEREQTIIRLPAELKGKLRQEADRKSSAKHVTLRLQMELYDELKIIAEQTGLTITSLLLVAIWWHVLKLKNLPQ